MATRRDLEDALSEVFERVAAGVSLASGCEDVCASIGLTPDEFDEFVVEHLAGDRAIAAEESR